MKSHEDIDQRSLELSRVIVALIDADPERKGLQKARGNCDRWLADHPTPVLREWQILLTRDWSLIRAVLLDAGHEGCRLRQSSPFCGILSSRERWDIYRRFHHEPKAA
jgi:hypothetical protein